MKNFDTRGDFKALYKLIIPEKKLIFKYTISLLVSSGSALSFPLAMVINN